MKFSITRHFILYILLGVFVKGTIRSYAPDVHIEFICFFFKKSLNLRILALDKHVGL